VHRYQQQARHRPGMWFEKQGKIFVSMPGVPNEMKGMMSDYVLPACRNILPCRHYFPHPADCRHRRILPGDRIKDFEEALPAILSWLFAITAWCVYGSPVPAKHWPLLIPKCNPFRYIEKTNTDVLVTTRTNR